MHATQRPSEVRPVPAFLVPLAVFGGFVLVLLSRQLPADPLPAVVGGALMLVGIATPILQLSRPSPGQAREADTGDEGAAETRASKGQGTPQSVTLGTLIEALYKRVRPDDQTQRKPVERRRTQPATGHRERRRPAPSVDEVHSPGDDWRDGPNPRDSARRMDDVSAD